MAMVYDITDKLRFNEDPTIRIRDVEITVCSDADVMLQLIDVMKDKGEMDAAVEASRLLFSAEDREKLKEMHLSISDYLDVLHAAVDLAMGNDPDGEPEKN